MGIALIHWLFMDIISYLLGFMMVTDRRIIEYHKSVFLREEMKEIPFSQITNIHHEKNGFLQNILNYGVLRIHSNVRDPVRMRFVPDSEEKFIIISRLCGAQKKASEASKEPLEEKRRRKRDRFVYDPLRSMADKIAGKKKGKFW